MAKNNIQFKTIAFKGKLADSSKIVGNLTQQVRAIVSDGQAFIATYPGQVLTKYRYRRTGTLKRSWSSDVKVTGRTVEGTIGSNANIAPYNQYVQGDPQARIFIGTGWRNIADLEKKIQMDTAERLQSGIDSAVGP